MATLSDLFLFISMGHLGPTITLLQTVLTCRITLTWSTLFFRTGSVVVILTPLTVGTSCEIPTLCTMTSVTCPVVQILVKETPLGFAVTVASCINRNQNQIII